MHPNLSDSINDNIARSEVLGGIYLENILPGETILVQTRNSRYQIHKDESDKFFLQSTNPRVGAPAPVEAHIHGSTFGGSMLKLGYIGNGMFMEFSLEGHMRYSPNLEREIPAVFTTSQIEKVEKLERV